MSDKELRQRVLDELEFDPSIDSAHIGVTAENGVVTLSGHVKTYVEKLAAARAAQRVRGVRGLAVEIEVRHPEDRKTADDEIAARALAIIEWSTSIPAQAVQVSVELGNVTLTGEVPWYFQKNAVERAVQKLSGVRRITNLITVRPSVSVDNVKGRIESALKRSADLEARQIRVDVDGDRVVLEGKVQSWQQREVAERAAWSVPGVHVVEDHLKIV